MKLVIIRHAEPDYENDSLTQKGDVEATLLAKWLKGKKIDAVYSSPLGRAHRTCMFSQKVCGFDFEIMPWMREFDAFGTDPDGSKRKYVWDLLPSYFTGHPLLYDREHWMEDELFVGSDIREKFSAVKEGFYALLKKHGYEKEEGSEGMFRVIRSNRDTVVLFCHYGILCVMLSALTGYSPYVFWQHFCALPSSVTTIVTEEREEGKAVFRCLGFGTLDHLALGGEEASFHARFCETFDSDERH